jgi:hypothetical protein
MPAKRVPKGGAAAKAKPGAAGSPAAGRTPAEHVPNQASQTSGASTSESDHQSNAEEPEDPNTNIPESGDMSALEWLQQQEEVNEFIESDRELVQFVTLICDQKMAAGQARTKSSERVQHLLSSMVTNPPRPPLEGLRIVRNSGM